MNHSTCHRRSLGYRISPHQGSRRKYQETPGHLSRKNRFVALHIGCRECRRLREDSRNYIRWCPDIDSGTQMPRLPRRSGRSRTPSHTLCPKPLTARLFHRRSLWTRDGKSAIKGVSAEGLVLTFPEQKTIRACIDKLDKCEVVAVRAEDTLVLALLLVF